MAIFLTSSLFIFNLFFVSYNVSVLFKSYKFNSVTQIPQKTSFFLQFREIFYGAPIYPKELSKEEQKFIGAYTQQKIQEMLDSHQI